MKPPWPEVCIELRLSPCPPSSQTAWRHASVCLSLGGEKKVLSSTKGKKIDRMEGIKGVKLH